ncbi:MAG: RHS repeat-associated core domain-containing protein [Solirubrobacterales bacterium]
MTNSSGENTGTYRFGPNGAVWKHTGTATSKMGFAGQYRMQTEHQLIYLRARTYDPTTAQFLAPDLLAAVSGETYTYAADNSVNISDPLGLDPQGCDCPNPPCPGDGPNTYKPYRIPELTATTHTESIGRKLAPYAWGTAVAVGLFFAPEVLGVEAMSITATWVYSSIGGAFQGVVETRARRAVGEEVDLHDYVSAAACGAATSGIFGALGKAAQLPKWGELLFAHSHSESYGSICDLVVHELRR